MLPAHDFEKLSAVSGSPRVVRLRPVGSRWRQAQMPVVVAADGVSKVFAARDRRPFTALSGVSFRLTSGSTVLVRGPSGSGKTTLLSLVGCMTRPTEGRIEVLGRDVSRLPEDDLALLRRSTVGFIFQANHLIRGASALANVMAPGLPSPTANGDLRDRARAVLARFDLESRLGERVERLSGGEQQRVAIARALINDPRMVLADEPTAHLDRRAGFRFLDFVEEMCAEGRTAVIASHDDSLAAAGVFSSVFELRAGRLRRVV
jgi:putative ABC transport system ATP-binding protein